MNFVRKVQRKKPYVIMLCGTAPGCGVTTWALSMASFLVSYAKRKVCYMEYRENSKLVVLGKDGMLCRGVPGFQMRGIDVFSVSYQDMEDLKKSRYDVFIIDADSAWDQFWIHVQTLFQADKIFVFGTYKPWKYREVQMFMKQLMNHEIEIRSGDFYGIDVNQEERQRFREEFHKKLKNLPVIQDPFHLSKQEIKWIGDLLINIK